MTPPPPPFFFTVLLLLSTAATTTSKTVSLPPTPSPTSSPTPTKPSPTPTKPSPTPTKPSPTPTAPSPTPTKPSPTRKAPSPSSTPTKPSPTPTTPSPTPTAPSPSSSSSSPSTLDPKQLRALQSLNIPTSKDPCQSKNNATLVCDSSKPFRHLLSLSLVNCSPNDVALSFTALKSLSSLHSLSFLNCPISPIRFPSELSSSLRSFTCVHSLKTLTGLWLSHLHNLTDLTVSATPVSTSGSYVILGNMKKLKSITISHANLTGYITKHLNLNLTHIDFSGNKLRGKIPNSITLLEDLDFLNLSSNALVGGIPSSFGDLISLQNLSLASNSLSGSIPTSMSAIPGLVHIDLSSNLLNGTIPRFISEMKDLKYLNLANNDFQGVMPFNGSFIKRLTVFKVGGNSNLCYNHSVLSSKLKLGIAPCDKHGLPMSPPASKADSSADDNSSDSDYDESSGDDSSGKSEHHHGPSKVLVWGVTLATTFFIRVKRISNFPEKYECSSSFPFSFRPSVSLFPLIQRAAQPGRKTHLSESLLNLAEIADGPLLFDSQKGFPRLTVLSIRSDGHRRHGPPRRSSDSRRRKEDENETPQSSDGKKSKSSNQEEIIALFRRIQSSISKGESLSTKKRNSNLSEDKPSSESILDVLRKSRKQVKDKTSDKEGDKVLTRRRGVPKKEQPVQNSQQVADLKSTRPPSKFVKRSPIPSPSTPRGKILELNDEALAARDGSKELNLLKIEGMKLTELKEVAKSRGMKGYSKLKKSELVELLRS